MAQLRTFDPPRLELCRSEAGGDYAYCLGLVDDDGKIVPPRCEGRTNFAVLADAPLIQNGREVFIAHDGQGMNIFFEDGHVAFVVPECWQDEIGDNPFCNIKQAREAGLHSRDASLGPSHFRPLGNE
jgi:prepilin-type processing-associated H-X9-DG protein